MAYEKAAQKGRADAGKFVDGQLAFAPGRIGKAARFDGQAFIDAGDVADFGYFDRFSIAAWIYPDGTEGGTVISRMEEHGESPGYNIHLQDGKLQLNVQDEIIRETMITSGGEVVNARVREFFKMPALAPALVPLAAAVAYSRVHTGVHYPSDVAAGAALGVASGVVALRMPPHGHEDQGA